ncbi:hypothetical protein BJF78_10305 [Pseudonocardia sp. CNS-139]|nr:hypothetical protein BJF78_10305 [Pseudonocardia sp. CNS-139]
MSWRVTGTGPLRRASGIGLGTDARVIGVTDGRRIRPPARGRGPGRAGGSSRAGRRSSSAVDSRGRRRSVGRTATAGSVEPGSGRSAARSSRSAGSSATGRVPGRRVGSRPPSGSSSCGLDGPSRPAVSGTRRRAGSAGAGTSRAEITGTA